MILSNKSVCNKFNTLGLFVINAFYAGLKAKNMYFWIPVSLFGEIMRRSYHIYCLILGLWLLTLLPSCRQAATSDSTAPLFNTDTAYVNQLISKARKIENADIALLLPISEQLLQIGRHTDNKKALIYAGIIKATYYWQSADHSQAMQIALKTLADAEKWKINTALPNIYRITANLHKEESNYDLADKEADNGLNAARLNHDTTAIIEMLSLKAMFAHACYLNMHPQGKDLASLGLQFEGLKIAESCPKYEQLRIRFYNNIAQTYKDQRDYDKTLEYAGKAVTLANKYNQLRSLTYSYSWLGEAYYYTGRHVKGLEYLNLALKTTQNIKEPYRQMEVYQSMYECYLSSQNYKEALTCINRVSGLRDSLQLVKSMRQTSSMQLKYEAVKKDQQILLLNQSGHTKNLVIMLVLISLTIFLVLCVILMYQYLTIRHKNKAIRHKNQILNEALLKIAHIQSHEVRKPLASILGLMNVFKTQNYEVNKDELLMVETSTRELDEKIRDIISATES